jgi:hypothetical protein
MTTANRYCGSGLQLPAYLLVACGDFDGVLNLAGPTGLEPATSGVTGRRSRVIERSRSAAETALPDRVAYGQLAVCTVAGEGQPHCPAMTPLSEVVDALGKLAGFAFAGGYLGVPERIGA